MYVESHLGGMLQLLGPAARFLTCSGPEKYIFAWQLGLESEDDVYLYVGVGHRKGPEEAT